MEKRRVSHVGVNRVNQCDLNCTHRPRKFFRSMSLITPETLVESTSNRCGDFDSVGAAKVIR